MGYHRPMRKRSKKDFSAGGLAWDGRRRKMLMVLAKNLAGAKVWTFPKGHPNRGETPKEAALREVWEETGWLCRAGRKIMDVRYSFSRSGVFYKKTVRWFLMAPQKKTGRFDPKEIIRSAWVGLREARRRMAYETDRALIKKAAPWLR